MTKEKDGRYYSDLINHNIGKFYDEDGNDTYCILPQFFTAHYGNDGLDGTFIFAQCCQSMGNSENSYSAAMANAFINASAETYIGFYNSVRTQYANNFMETYVDGLIDGKTSQAAFDAAKDKHGKNDWIIKDIVHNRPTAIPYLIGNEEAKLWVETEKPEPEVPDNTTTETYYPVHFEGLCSFTGINIPWLSDYVVYEATVAGEKAYIVVEMMLDSFVNYEDTYSAGMSEIGTVSGKTLYHAVHLSRSLV